jgi:hypothetical protein
MEMQSTHLSPAPSANYSKVTEEDLKEVLEGHKKSFPRFYESQILPIIQQQHQLLQQQQKLLNQKGGLNQTLVELKNKSEALAKKREELDKKSEELAKRGEEAKTMQAEGRAMKAAGLKGLEEVAKKRQDLLTKQFYTIFNKTPLPIEEIDTLFKTYLADGSLTTEKSPAGSYPKINSMKAVIRYLDDHPDIKTCNFLIFKTAVHDIPTLADYLKKSTIKAIGLNSGIPNDAKASLAEAVNARNGSLKVQYLS